MTEKTDKKTHGQVISLKDLDTEKLELPLFVTISKDEPVTCKLTNKNFGEIDTALLVELGLQPKPL